MKADAEESKKTPEQRAAEKVMHTLVSLCSPLAVRNLAPSLPPAPLPPNTPQAAKEAEEEKERAREERKKAKRAQNEAAGRKALVSEGPKRAAASKSFAPFRESVGAHAQPSQARARGHTRTRARTHARTYPRTHARTHARTYPRTHAGIHARARMH